MKKIVFSVFLALACLILPTSCCDKNKCGADQSIPAPLADSLSMSLGAFTGARLNGYVGQDLSQAEIDLMQDDLQQFIEGFQLVVGNKMSQSKLSGIYAALEVMREIEGAENTTGMDINRDLYLKEFRKYIQKKDLTHEDISALYFREQALRAAIEAILVQNGATEAIDEVIQDEQEMTVDNDSVSVNVEEMTDSIVLVNPTDNEDSDIASTQAL